MLNIGMIFIIIGTVVHQFEAMLIKSYATKHGKGSMFFNAFICLFAIVYFLFSDKGGLQFHRGIIIYGVVNSAMYALGFYTIYVAYKTGSFGLTKLFSSFSVLFSTLYGIIFLGEPTNVLTYIAFIMILISLFLMNYQKQEKVQRIRLKWVISIFLTVLANAAIAIIGRMQFGAFGNTYKNEFLIISLGGAAISLFVLGLVFERGSFKSTVKYGMLYGAGAGIFNGINNLLTLVTYNYLAISIASPVKTGLGMVMGFLISLVFYKEKFSRYQVASVVIGTVAVVLMNL